MIQHYSTKQRRVIQIKHFLKLFKNRNDKIGVVFHFIIKTVSLKNIKYQVKIISLRIDVKHNQSNIPNVYDHENSGGPLLDEMFSVLDIQPTDSIIDVGSGKGGVIMTLCEYPFKRVDGIEIDRNLYEISKKNLSKIHPKSTTIYLADARIFNGYGNYNFFYLFNPFPPTIMKDVLNQIAKTLITNPREICMVYYNPECHSIVAESGIFIKHINPNNGINVRIYTTDRNFKLKELK